MLLLRLARLHRARHHHLALALLNLDQRADGALQLAAGALACGDEQEGGADVSAQGKQREGRRPRARAGGGGRAAPVRGPQPRIGAAPRPVWPGRGPTLTCTVWPSTLTVTLAGTGTGFLPMRLWLACLGSAAAAAATTDRRCCCRAAGAGAAPRGAPRIAAACMVCARALPAARAGAGAGGGRRGVGGGPIVEAGRPGAPT